MLLLGFPPKGHIPIVPSSADFTPRFLASYVRQQQRASNCIWSAQPQRHPVSAILSPQCCGEQQAPGQSNRCSKPKAIPALYSVATAHHVGRIAWTRGSSFRNLSHPSFEPMISVSTASSISGFLVFSLSSTKNGRTFAKMKNNSPQNAVVKNNFSLSTPFSTNEAAIPQ